MSRHDDANGAASLSLLRRLDYLSPTTAGAAGVALGSDDENSGTEPHPVTGEDPGWPEGPADERPVNNVTWFDAVRFCKSFSRSAKSAWL